MIDKVPPASCGNCRYGITDSPSVIMCKRYPPTITKAEGPNVTTYFPLVLSNNWCGEHKPKLNGKRR